jgi:hypothetical protein
VSIWLLPGPLHLLNERLMMLPPERLDQPVFRAMAALRWQHVSTREPASRTAEAAIPGVIDRTRKPTEAGWTWTALAFRSNVVRMS